MRVNAKTVLSYNNFDNLTTDIIELAKEIMPDKAIHINFLNNETQVTLKVAKGNTKVNVIEGTTIPVEEAICNNIDYEGRKPLIIEDTTINNLSEKVNQTIKNENIGSYLGIPITFKDGKRFGTLCVTHNEKAHFGSEDIKLLEKIANLFSYYIELENHAYIDDLTGLKNSRYLLLNQEEMLKKGGLLLMLDLDNFKLVNDTFGHHLGDLLLQEIGQKIRGFTKKFKDSIAIRLGGDEFLIYINDEFKKEEIIEYLKNLNAILSSYKTDIKDLKVTSSIGAYEFLGNKVKNYTTLYNKVDILLYKAKKNKKNTFVFESQKK